MARERHEADGTALGVWSSDLLHDSANWPHSERDARIVGTPAGLRVEVAAERRFAIAAMSGLALRKDLGQIRVRVAEMGGGATWFVRLYGELRQPGQHRTAAIAQDEATRGERVFPVDPRLRQLTDESHVNNDQTTFGLPSYVGDPRRSSDHPGTQEGITCMGAVLGATLVGIDKSRAVHDYVRMCEAWFNESNGLNLVLNYQRQETGGSFWYEIWPHIVFYALSDRYPDKPRLAEIMHTTADRWCQACRDLARSGNVPDFDHTSYNFRTRQPVDNGRWKEPDAAAGVAWLEYTAWAKFQEPKYLDAAENCLRFLQNRTENPYYEVLLPDGALVAVRLNAELDRDYDVDRLLDWCFGISDCRGGWGVTVGRWGEYDCDGLVGSIDNRCGYAFAMNTFTQAAALVPLVRYDPRYARAIGKWMLNLSNSARLFYPGELPPEHQTSQFWQGDPKHVIAYEGLRHHWQGKSPCATGDPVTMNWGPKTDLGLYGSGYVGMLGSIVRPTDVPCILQLDCLATDFFRSTAYPTFLCYNPYRQDRSFQLDVGSGPADLYDAVTHRFVARDVDQRANVTLPADSAALFVVTPSGGQFTRVGKRTLVDGVVIDWR